MDGPSVFGAMLDRDAGGFRLGPADTRVPAGRRYLPGHDDRSRRPGARAPAGCIVRDVLLIGPVAPRGRALAHPPPLAHRLRRRPRPAAHDALRQRLGRDATWTASRCSTTAARASTWEYTGDGYHQAVAARRGPGPRADADHRPAARLRGRARRARTTMRDGDIAFVALSWSEHGGPDDATTRPTSASCGTADYWHEWLSRGEFPDHPWRTLPAAQRADAQGPDLRADRAR